MTITNWKEKAAKVGDIEGFTKLFEEMASGELDYCSFVEATAILAVAAVHLLDRSPQGGMTGAQAQGLVWEFINQWDAFGEAQTGPMKLIFYQHMLFPQYFHDFQKVIPRKTWDHLQKEARRLLEENKGPGNHVAPRVYRHWQTVAGGGVPFGYRVED